MPTVHRVGKKIQGRRRPIIARFVCREDRDKVKSVRGNIKESMRHTLMHTSHRITPGLPGGTEGIDQSYDESPRGTWSKRYQSERSIFVHKQ